MRYLNESNCTFVQTGETGGTVPSYIPCCHVYISAFYGPILAGGFTSGIYPRMVCFQLKKSAVYSPRYYRFKWRGESRNQPVRVDYYPGTVHNLYNKPYCFAHTSYNLFGTMLCTLNCVNWCFTSRTTCFCPDRRNRWYCTMLYTMLLRLHFGVLWADSRGRHHQGAISEDGMLLMEGIGHLQPELC